jgi:ADP-L-glycero-D-manno-heptose 6-epimerase
MIVVTGGAGFIGSNLVKALNERGRSDVLVVDDLTNGRKVRNLADCDILDLLQKDEFLSRVRAGSDLGGTVDVMFHQGASSDTMEWNGAYMLENNYHYSKALLAFALERGIPFLYASSASVYGSTGVFVEERKHEAPLNPYAYSKFLFDCHVRRLLPRPSSQVVGLRYFNVYGPREQHKGRMASVAYKLHGQVAESGEARLFEGSDGYGDGEHERDFVWVGDAVSVNLWFWDHPDRSGIFNLGAGRAQSFNDVARAVIAFHGRGEIVYVPFPDELRQSYQSFTRADLSALRGVGYTEPFLTVEEGVKRYLEWLTGDAGR